MCVCIYIIIIYIHNVYFNTYKKKTWFRTKRTLQPAALGEKSFLKNQLKNLFKSNTHKKSECAVLVYNMFKTYDRGHDNSKHGEYFKTHTHNKSLTSLDIFWNVLATSRTLELKKKNK